MCCQLAMLLLQGHLLAYIIMNDQIVSRLLGDNLGLRLIDRRKGVLSRARDCNLRKVNLKFLIRKRPL
jgi:hypothetical protein